jgi:predicted nuclease of predicted toxin-antitoxin system
MDYYFLVDVNLPKFFIFFNHPNFTHVVDIDPHWTDKEIWEYALEKNYVILSKDVDFYNRFIASDISPKIIYLQLGNLSLKNLYAFFEENWSNILLNLNKGKLFYVTLNNIKIIE